MHLVDTANYEYFGHDEVALLMALLTAGKAPQVAAATPAKKRSKLGAMLGKKKRSDKAPSVVCIVFLRSLCARLCRPAERLVAPFRPS